MSDKRFLKNVITSSKVEPTTNDAHIAGVASGVWSLEEALEYKRGGAWPDATVANPDTLIENNYSTFLYNGDGSTRTIANGIDLANKGGLVWLKRRDDAQHHYLYDTERGATKVINSSLTNAESTLSTDLTGFASNGFTLGNGDNNTLGDGTRTFVSWTFKKALKFLDVVTYTGNGGNLTVDHNLGSVPGMIIIKCTSAVKSWVVYHRGANGGSSPEDFALFLNTTGAQDDNLYFQDTAPTSTQFFLGDSAANENNQTHVAYLFAHETGSDSMIQCGSYTGNGNATGPSIDLGWEPQWLLTKAATRTSDWSIVDSMRGVITGGVDQRLHPQSSEAEPAAATHSVDMIDFNAKGFNVKGTGTIVNGNTETYIYVAIRRPNMATITDATKVFAVSAPSGSTKYTSGFPVDMAIYKIVSGGNSDGQLGARLLGEGKNIPNDTSAQGTNSGQAWDVMDGFNAASGFSSNSFAWMWKRAKGYFDVVAYKPTQSGSGNEAITHGLGVVPEMIWVKADSGGSNDDWAVYHANISGTPHNNALELNQVGGTSTIGNQQFYWGQAHTSTQFYVYNGQGRTGDDGQNYIAYLFATLAGVSKCGGVTHSGSSTDVDCGFTSGARFVLLKRHDADGDWFLWDSTRGIVAGNDPYIKLNLHNQQVTNEDLIDPLASGFQISGDFTDGDYIFYAVA